MTTNKKAAPVRAAQNTIAAANCTEVSSADKITILETLGPSFTKTYGRHEGEDITMPYDDAASLKVSSFEANSLRDVADKLGKLHKNVKKCFIRGKFVGEDKAQPAFKPGTWTRTNANFDDQPLHWFMIDIDGFKPSWSHPVETVASSVMEYIEEVLPPCFKGASFYWHLSSSAGMPGKEEFLKCHVHFWSKTPYTSAQMKVWAKGTSKLIDSAVYSRVQVHYTADPVFKDGRVDPVKVRAGWHQGEHDEVDLVIGEEVLAQAHSAGSGTGGNDMKLKDPSEKEGLIGLFHETFDAEDALLTLLDEFEQVSQRRYTWLEGGGTPEGVWVHDDGMHIGSSHNTWPLEGIANLWDVVRVFKFGDMDHHKDPFEQMNIDTLPVGVRPSDKAMYEWADQLPEIRAARASEKTTKLGDMVLAQIAEILHRTNDKDELAKELKFDSEKISQVLAAMAFNPANSKFWLMTPDFGGVISTEKDLPLMVGEHYGSFMSNVRAAVERAAGTLRFDGDSDRKAWVKETMAKVQESPIKALITKTKAYRQFSKVDLEVDMFATTGSMRVHDGTMVLVYTHQPFAVGAINQVVIKDYKEHFPEFDDFIDLLTASRFASSRKKSHVWLNCDSDWGKSFLMSVLANLRLVVETSVGELEKMLAGGPVGKTIDEFKRIWCLAVDEFKGVKSEVKQLSEHINFAPKGLPTVQAPLYLKLFMSAEAVDSLASEDSGIEDQFANRFLYIDGKGSIEARSLFANSKGSYMSSLVSYLGQRLNERVDYFRSLGAEGAADAADNELVALYEKYRIDRKFKRLSIAIPDLARRFAEDCATAYCRPHYQRTRFQREAAPHVVETPSHGLCLERPAPVLKLWITETFGQSEGGKLSYKRSNIMQALGGSKSIRGVGNECFRGVVLGIPLPAAGPERDFSD